MQITLSREEAIAILQIPRSNWIPLDLQKVIFFMITKIEKALEEDSETY